MMTFENLKVCVAQLGARRHYVVPRILAEAGMLEKLYTDTYAGKFPLNLLRLCPPGLAPAGLRRLLGRSASLPPDRVSAFQSFGFAYARKCAGARTATEATAVSLEYGRQFAELVVRKGFGQADAVYAYRSAALEIFQAARKQGLITVLDQTIAPKKIEDNLLHWEYEEASGWDGHDRDDLLDAYAERERREWELADLILCGSDFVRDGVIRSGGAPEKCRVVPTGADFPNRPAEDDGIRCARPLRVLFVGQVSLRKGIRHLCRAMGRLEGQSVECRVVGPLKVDEGSLARNVPENMQILGPVPRTEVVGHYAWADVFCLPSLCEGSALVTYEALSAGLPVITTPNSGSIVRDGVEGAIIPAMDAEAIALAVERFLECPETLQRMSAAARARAGFGSTAAYAGRLVHVLKSGCKDS